MIQTIKSIKGFGVFADFRWPTGLPEFKQFNLIYGCNYSGKTTLSRAFRWFETKIPHPDFAGAQAELKSRDSSIHLLADPESAPVFRVFNSDFVRENIAFDTGSTTPILILGASDIAKQEILKIKRTERDALNASRTINAKKIVDTKLAIEKAQTKYARDLIKNPLSIPSYDRTNFVPRIIECKNSPESHSLDTEHLTRNLSIYKSTDKKSPISAKMVSMTPVTELAQKTSLLLARSATASSPISRLESDPVIERWVNQGRPLHIGKDSCQFCDQPLPPNLLLRLAGHFSADYEKLMAQLNSLENEIKSAQEEGIPLEHQSNFYPELSERFVAEKNKLDDLIKARKASLSLLLKSLADKKTKAFTAIKLSPIDDPSALIAKTVETINALISEHNHRSAEFDQKRKEALHKLEAHYAALFVRDEKFNEQTKLIESLESSIAEHSKKSDQLDAEIRSLEQALSEAARGAEHINALLYAYFGKDDLQIQVTPDKRFQIFRRGSIAKNLSEGEKTAIAFAHFITRAQDGQHPLADIRIVIDDPISSLDANHLFNTYALIKTKLSGCCQLFILTHNFEFFNLIKEWAKGDEKNDKKPLAEWMKWGLFLIKRTSTGDATLEEIPKELLRFNSEYHYLFSTMYHFEKRKTGDFDFLLSLPNITRRFMEAFGGIMIPTSMGLSKKMPRLFPDGVERERVWKFINHYSHIRSIAPSLTITDTGECVAVVQACLKAVREWDSDYFKALEAEVM